jgi:hypothetical protein
MSEDELNQLEREFTSIKARQARWHARNDPTTRHLNGVR